jgi:two-component system sensor histidine kinase RegB
MGLGLFIAKTLLERTRAKLIFANGTSTYATKPSLEFATGAVVSVIWDRKNLIFDSQIGPENMPVQI